MTGPSELQPGDLCEVIETVPEAAAWKGYVGLLVREFPGCEQRSGPWCPHWEIVGCNEYVFSWRTLRKLPPLADYTQELTKETIDA